MVKESWDQRGWGIFYVPSLFKILLWFLASQNRFQNPWVSEERPYVILLVVIGLHFLPLCPSALASLLSFVCCTVTHLAWLLCPFLPPSVFPCSSPHLRRPPPTVKCFSCEFDVEGSDGQCEHIYLAYRIALRLICNRTLFVKGWIFCLSKHK